MPFASHYLLETQHIPENVAVVTVEGKFETIHILNVSIVKKQNKTKTMPIFTLFDLRKYDNEFSSVFHSHMPK